MKSFGLRLIRFLAALGIPLLGARALPAQAAAAPSGQLEKLRLLPPVLIAGRSGDTLTNRMRYYKVEAVSVAVIQDFRVLWTEARGLADREAKAPASTATLFQAGSISKPVAAAGILRRVEAGQLQLDRDVNGYLKSWKVPDNEFTAKAKVTLERLLSHSAGLTVHGFPGYAVGEAVPTVPQILDGAAPANTAPVRVDFVPGSKVRYSGGGITISQLVQTDTTGKAFPALLRELVLAPAGMTHSTYEQPLPKDELARAAAGYRRDGSALAGKRHTYPEMAAAGLWTTSEDLARFAIAIAKSVRGDSGSLLPRDLANRMTTPFLETACLGFFQEKHGGQDYFGHDGADEGFQALLLMSREKGFGAAVMANSDNGVALAQEIVRGIARAYQWSGYLPETLASAALTPSDLQALAGRYRVNAAESLAILARDGRLFGKPPIGDEYEIFPVSRDLLTREDRPTRYEVERSGGAVTGVGIVAGEERVSAPRLPEGERLALDDVAAGKISEGIAAYHRLFAARPDDPAVAEPRLNQLGYELAAAGRRDQAIAVLSLNTQLRPASANTYDSLAEVLEKQGDHVRAAEASRKVLEVVDADPKADPATKELLRKNAKARLPPAR